MSSPNQADLTGLAGMLAANRDKAYAKAADANARFDELASERRTATGPDSVFAEIARDNMADRVRAEALAEWSAYALALDALCIYTGGEFGERYKDMPSAYRAGTREGAST